MFNYVYCYDVTLPTDETKLQSIAVEINTIRLYYCKI